MRPAEVETSRRRLRGELKQAALGRQERHQTQAGVACCAESQAGQAGQAAAGNSIVCKVPEEAVPNLVGRKQQSKRGQGGRQGYALVGGKREGAAEGQGLGRWAT